MNVGMLHLSHRRLVRHSHAGVHSLCVRQRRACMPVSDHMRAVLAFGNGLEGVPGLRQNVVVDWNGQPRNMESRIIARPSSFLKRWTRNP